jgi:hypothetical protein
VIASLVHLVTDGTGATADELAFEILLISAGLSLFAGLSRIRGRAFPRIPRPLGFGLVALSGVLVAAAIVVPPKLRPTIAAVRPRSTARLEIVSPTPGQVVSGQLLTVRLDLMGGTIAAVTTTNLTPDTGHIHLSVDGSLVSMTYGTVQRILISNLAPGPHVLQAEYVAADHGPFNPPVRTSVTFVKR